MGAKSGKEESLIRFVSNFLELCFVKCDFKKLTSLLDKEAVFVGLNIDYEDVFLERYNMLRTLSVNENYIITQIDEKSYLVQGNLNKNSEDNFKNQGYGKNFSLICIEKGESFVIKHGHFSGLGNEVDYSNSNKKDDLKQILDNRKSLIQGLMDNICGGVQICTYDDDFSIKFMSEGFTDMLGYTMEELWNSYEGKHINLVCEQDREFMISAIKEQLSYSDSFAVEYRMCHKNGNIVWVLDKGKIISGPDEVMDVQCILTDITDTKLQEEELKISKKRYEIALKFSGVSMFEYSFIKKTLTLFDNINDMYNMPEVIEDGVNTFVKTGIIIPECERDYRAMYKAVENGAKSASCLIKTRDKDGGIHDYELSLTTVFDKDGKVDRAIGVRRNITDFVRLTKEKEFAQRLAQNKDFIMEINITKNRLEYMATDWQKEIKVDQKTNFTYFIKEYVDYYIVPEHREYVKKHLSLDFIKSQGKLGKYSYMFSYKRKDENGIHYKWYESVVTIVKEKSTGDMVARVHREDVNELKEKELKALEEQRRYRHMVDKCTYAFEINYTKDIMYKGHEHWYVRNNMPVCKNYSQVIRDFAAINLSPEDGYKFIEAVQREKMLALFERGQRNFTYECNEIFPDGSSRWLECDLYFYEDVENGDVRCFAYMNDINDRKCQEIKLMYDAEHDAMTGMFNKVKVEEKIDLALKDTKDDRMKALLVIDIDYFKNINDNFGHVFGDEVIRDVSKIIFSVFRKSDIIGRIGGDEFCIFMEGVTTMSAIEKKAEELRLVLCKTYTKDGKTIDISASVGIAIGGLHGNTYHELYINADSALYEAKNSGKNKYKISN